jgi:acetyl-CoA acetyltransferase
MSTEAVIVSTARTGVGKAYRGALNNTDGPTLAGHVMAEAVKRAGIAPGEVEDVVMGCAMQQGTMVMNVARKGAICAGLPVTVGGTTIDRQCASGLQAIAVAARSVMLDGVEIAIGGGIESISLVQNEHKRVSRRRRGTDGDEAGDVHVDAGDRRGRRRTLRNRPRQAGRIQPGMPAPRRRRVAGRALQ